MAGENGLQDTEVLFVMGYEGRKRTFVCAQLDTAIVG